MLIASTEGAHYIQDSLAGILLQHQANRAGTAVLTALQRTLAHIQHVPLI